MFAAIIWGWTALLLALLLVEGFSAGFREGWSALTQSLALLFFFFVLPLVAFAVSLLLAFRMSRGDLRDRPLAIALIVIGIPWAAMQTFGVLLGI